MKKLLFSIFDLTGNWSAPYRLNGWIVEQVDIQTGIDFLNYDFNGVLKRVKPDAIGILFACPCTDYALSGAKHFKRKDLDGSTTLSQAIVARCKQLYEACVRTGKLLFWALENPKTRIHKLNPWLGKVKQKFHPSDFAGYADAPYKERYKKETWLFGHFNDLTTKADIPYSDQSPIHRDFGGKSIKTKNARSITPQGFARAFYEANHI